MLSQKGHLQLTLEARNQLVKDLKLLLFCGNPYICQYYVDDSEQGEVVLPTFPRTVGRLTLCWLFVSEYQIQNNALVIRKLNGIVSRQHLDGCAFRIFLNCNLCSQSREVVIRRLIEGNGLCLCHQQSKRRFQISVCVWSFSARTYYHHFSEQFSVLLSHTAGNRHAE